jgi:hypothetical protein
MKSRETRRSGTGIDLNGRPSRNGNLPRRQVERPKQQHAPEKHESQRDHQKETTGTSPPPSSLYFAQHKVIFYNRFL